MAGSEKMAAEESPGKVVAAIPCYNEEAFVRAVVLGVRKFVDEVIVVDDGSTDGTSQVAEEAGAIVFRHPVNEGYGAAVRSCFKMARKRKASVLVIIDGDGQHRSEDLPSVIAPVLKGEADLVIGSRFLGQGNRVPGYRRFGIGVITFLINFGAKVKVSDAQSGFRAYSHELFQHLNPRERGMAVSVEVLIRSRRKGFRIKEVPISCLYHPWSSTLNPVTHGLGVALQVLRIRIKVLFSSWARRLGLARGPL